MALDEREEDEYCNLKPEFDVGAARRHYLIV